MNAWKITLLVFSACALFSCGKDEKPPNREGRRPPHAEFLAGIDTTQAIGYVVLDMEKKAGLPVGEAEYTLLGDLIAAAGPYLPDSSKQSGRGAALRSLRGIALALEQAGAQPLTYQHSFAMCLRYRYFDCDINTLLYLTIAEHYGLPISGLLMPAHISVLWQADSLQLYWETTEKRERSLRHYLDKYNLQAPGLQPNGILLRPMGKTQLIGMAFYNIGQTFAAAGNRGQAVAHLRNATLLCPDWFAPHAALGHVYADMDYPETAVYYCNRAIKYHPQSLEAWEVLAVSYARLGCITEAEEAFGRFGRLLLPGQTDRQARLYELGQRLGRYGVSPDGVHSRQSSI